MSTNVKDVNIVVLGYSMDHLMKSFPHFVIGTKQHNNKAQNMSLKFFFSDLFNSVSGRLNKRKVSSVGPVHKKQKVEGCLKYRTKAGASQKKYFHRRKVFGSKISKKHKH
jgi:hypothetical protein